MANKKFSEFDLSVNVGSVSELVGLNGTRNVKITPTNLLADVNSAIADNEQAITDETNARILADTDLANDIATNATNISTNESAISSEIINRGNADATLQSNIDDEEAARIAGDANLQGQIDAITTGPTEGITEVSAGQGLIGGGTSGNVTLDVQLVTQAGDGLISSPIPPPGVDVVYEIDPQWMRFDGFDGTFHIGSGFQDLPSPNEPIQIDSSDIYFNTGNAFYFTGHNNFSTTIYDGVMGNIYSSNGPMAAKNLAGIIDVDYIMGTTRFENAYNTFMRVNIDNNVGFNLPINIEPTERIEVRGNQSISYTDGQDENQGILKIEQDLEGGSFYYNFDKGIQWGFKNGDPNSGYTEAVDARVNITPAMAGLFGSGVVIKTQQNQSFVPPPFDATVGQIAAYPFSPIMQQGGVVLGDGAEYGPREAKVTIQGDCSQQYAPLVAKFESSNGGVQFPNLSTSDRDNMQNIGNYHGTVIYNTDAGKLQVFAGNPPSWKDLHS